MIFGGTREQYHDKLKRKFKVAKCGTIKFAWTPQLLPDGRKVWLARYKRYYSGTFQHYESAVARGYLWASMYWKNGELG